MLVAYLKTIRPRFFLLKQGSGSCNNFGINLDLKKQSLDSDEGIEAIQVPWLAQVLTPNTIVDWNFTTTPQIGLGNRSISYPRGRVLGGSSSVSK